MFLNSEIFETGDMSRDFLDSKSHHLDQLLDLCSLKFHFKLSSGAAISEYDITVETINVFNERVFFYYDSVIHSFFSQFLFKIYQQYWLAI